MTKVALESFYKRKKMSLTLSSLFITALGFIFERAGIKVGTEEIGTFINVTLQIVGAIGIYWGRYRQGNVNWFGRKV